MHRQNNLAGPLCALLMAVVMPTQVAWGCYNEMYKPIVTGFEYPIMFLSGLLVVFPLIRKKLVFFGKPHWPVYHLVFDLSTVCFWALLGSTIGLLAVGHLQPAGRGVSNQNVLQFNLLIIGQLCFSVMFSSFTAQASANLPDRVSKSRFKTSLATRNCRDAILAFLVAWGLADAEATIIILFLFTWLITHRWAKHYIDEHAAEAVSVFRQFKRHPLKKAVRDTVLVGLLYVFALAISGLYQYGSVATYLGMPAYRLDENYKGF